MTPALPTAPSALRIVIVAAGDVYPEDVTDARIQPEDVIIAADGGANACTRFGLMPNIIIGDLDSIDADIQAAAETHGCRVERHPRQKDQTDLELALDRAEAMNAERIVVLGALGGRWDMTAGNINLLAARAVPGRRIEVRSGGHAIFPLAGPDRLDIFDRSGATVSLVPVGHITTGLTLTGMQYALDGEDLPLGSTRGISNRIVADQATVILTGGRVLIVLTPPDLPRRAE